jgi:hypothetical protein
MENCKKYIALILILLVCSCKTTVIKPKYTKKEAKIKQGYYNGIQFGNKDMKKKYGKKFNKLTKGQ